MRRNLWSIVLAAGSGRRLVTVTGGVPKQFWCPPGGVSLLEATLQRVAPLTAPERTIVIVDESHRAFAAPYAADDGRVMVYQPLDRGTAAGVLMALVPVLSADPHGLVVLTPSDHSVQHEEGFRQGVRQAAARAAKQNDVILFGVQPTHATEDYGWIVPAGGISDLRSVKTFIEKPSADVAGHLLTVGALWNTMVVVARASTLRALFVAHLPDLANVFNAAAALPEHERHTFLADIYPALQPRDFSRDLLERARGLKVYTWPEALGWSDLGTPARLRRWQSAGAA